MKLPTAEEMPYWRTSRRSADASVEEACRLVEKHGGELLEHAFGRDPRTGLSGYLIAFNAGGDTFKIVWPVLPSSSGNDRAARVQAARMLVHDIKGRLVRWQVFGARQAFFEHLVLPDGRRAGQLSDADIAAHLPDLVRRRLEGR